jgi:hypothetical protein
MNRSFDDNLRMGDVARDWVADRLMSERWSVVPLDKIPASNGHGPRSSGRGGLLTLPDLQITKHGTTLAVEVKGKTIAWPGKLSGELEHGIEERLYDDYLDYDRQIMPTFVVVVELGPEPWNGRDTYAARVTELRPRLSTFNGRAMAYWPRKQMTSDWLLRLDRSIVARNNAVARQVAQSVSPEQLGFAL